MLIIRRSEERLARDFTSGLLPGPVHLYIGQEAIAAGVCAHLRRSDLITSTHRGHGHFIAKGGDLKAMFAEIYGRAMGICGGMGGSMHVTDIGCGMLGANGIVGAGIPIAAGAALTVQMQGKGDVCVAFFGDGAAGQGVFAEVLNIASLWRLPLILVCENNGFSEFSPTRMVTAGSIADRAKPYGIEAIAIDGNDLLSVWDAAGVAIDRARSGAGPSVIEALTYRIRGHVEGEASFLRETYRTDAEVKHRMCDDPIARVRLRLLASAAASDDELASMERDVEAIVAAAADNGSAGAWPDAATLRSLTVGAIP